MTVKTCSSCGEQKSLKEFYPHKNSKDGFINQCRKCISIKRKQKYCPEKAREQNRKSKYRITTEDYNRLLKVQENKCGICRKLQPDDYHGLCVDHNHKTGNIRGLLCHNCNSALGNFYDNPDYLLSAVLYLQRSDDALASKP